MNYVLAVAFATFLAWILVGLVVVVIVQRSDIRHFQEMAKYWREKAAQANNREWRCARIHEDMGEEFSCPRRPKGGSLHDEETR